VHVHPREVARHNTQIRAVKGGVVEKTARDEIFRSVRVNRPLSRHARSLLSGRAPLCYTSPPINPLAGEPQ